MGTPAASSSPLAVVAELLRWKDNSCSFAHDGEHALSAATVAQLGSVVPSSINTSDRPPAGGFVFVFSSIRFSGQQATFSLRGDETRVLEAVSNFQNLQTQPIVLMRGP